MSTLTIDQLAHKVHSCGSDDLPVSVYKALARAGSSIKANLTKSPGLSRSEYDILIFVLGEEEEPYDELIRAALSVADSRRNRTPSDDQIIKLAIDKIREEVRNHGEEHLSDNERQVLRFATSQGANTTRSTAHSASSTLLSDVSKIFNSLNLGERSVDELDTHEQVQLAGLMHRRPDRFNVIGDKFPLPPKMPELPSHTGITMADLPDTLELIEDAIERRCKAEEDVSLFLLRNRGLVARLRIKQAMIRRGENMV
ncbi:hypothetical protein FPOA_09209 [Fusarium poae]|uniref:Uncharacterized protein n=1 Tax=Fusarium poae TaxID=36050 RepID=A0A1B8AR85_FUSPO|nr:hypothetical protein FPOA_09209 [Fusarium poae]